MAIYVEKNRNLKKLNKVFNKISLAENDFFRLIVDRYKISSNDTKLNSSKPLYDIL